MSAADIQDFADWSAILGERASTFDFSLYGMPVKHAVISRYHDI